LRAGPLSNPKVIALLNAHFVCVYTSNDDITGDDLAKEKAERQRIYGEFTKSKLGSGMVSPYVLTIDAQPLTRLSIGPACEKDNLLKLLEKVVEEQKLAKGDPVVKPEPQNPAPKVPADALLLQLTARKLTPKYSWNEFPSEDWIVLTKEQWKKLVPAADVKAGTAWDIDKAVSAHILTHFFPPTEVCTAKEDVLLSETERYRHKLEQHALKATVLSVQDGVVRVRLDGSLKLNHSFYPGRQDTNAFVEGTVVGYVDYDTSKKKIAALRLVTVEATYVKTPIGVAARSVP